MAEETTSTTGEETTTTTTTAAAETTAAAASPDDELLRGAQNPDAVKNALKREREAAREAQKRADEYAAKVKEFEDRDKTEQQKLEERATTAEQSAAKAEARALRFEVAAAKGLPLNLASRLQGEDKAAMERDADELLKVVKADTTTVDFGGGPRGTPANTGDMDAMIRSAAGRA